MKKNKLSIGLLAILTIFSSCDGDYNAIKNGAFFEEAVTLTGKKVLVDEKGGTTTLKVRLADKVSKDVTLTLEVDESVLEEFNHKMGTGYKILPPEFYEFNAHPVVSANKMETDFLPIHIKPFSKELEATGLKYAIPLRIVSTNGGFSPVGDEASFVLMIDQTIVTKAFVLRANEAIRLKLKEVENDESLVMPDFTVEFWLCPTAKSHGLFTSGYGEGHTHEVWFTLFNWGTNDQPGVKMRNNYFNSGVKVKFKQWQHIALTYNGVTGSSKIYVDGKLRIERSTASGSFLFKPWVNGCSTGNSWLAVREYRIWNVERSQAQIENNMETVDPSSVGLLGYWKMNEGIGAVFNDCSGNAKEGFIYKNGQPSADGDWVDYRSDRRDVMRD